MDKMISVAGPTASGKTARAVWLAQRLNGEVVSCDSMQVYRGMDIGTAKPTLAERQGIPHHMLDVAEPEEAMSVGKFTAMATPVVEDILARGKTVILAGGTGLYMDALVRGNAFAPAVELQAVDPDSAARLHPGDEKRIIRALEVYRQTGKTLTQHNAETRQKPDKYHPVWLGLDYADRAQLYRRIDLRVEQMISGGLLEEIRSLLAAGLGPETTALQAIGYKEFLDYLAGRCTLAEAVAAVQQATRRYAKRQLTWFRRNPQMIWLHRQPGDFSQVCAEAAANISFFDEGKW